MAIISEALERRLFGADAVGQQLVRSGGETEQALVEVIGVAASVKQHGLGDEELDVTYFPNWQSAGIRQLVVRTSGHAANTVPLIRHAAQEVGLTVTSAISMTEQVAAATRGERTE